MKQKVNFFKHNGKWLKSVPQSESFKADVMPCMGCIADDDSDLCDSLRDCGGIRDGRIFQYPSKEELSILHIHSNLS